MLYHPISAMRPIQDIGMLFPNLRGLTIVRYLKLCSRGPKSPITPNAMVAHIPSCSAAYGHRQCTSFEKGT